MGEYPLTIDSLVDEVADTVRGFTRGGEEVTSLAAPMTDVANTFTVSAADVLSRGTAEIEDEIVQIKTVDTSTGVVTTEAWGRGVNGSVAVAHNAGVRITASPTYPRSRIRSTISGTLREIFPSVYPVAEALLAGNPGYVSYTLPDDAYDVLAVHNRMVGPGAEWVPLRRWRADKTLSAVNLMLYSAVQPGTDRVRVTYMRTPPQLDGSVDLQAVGYDSGIRDIVVLGATAKLMAYTEPGRVELSTVESNARALGVQGGTAIALSRNLYQMFQKRVDDARQMLLMRYPPQPHNATR